MFLTYVGNGLLDERLEYTDGDFHYISEGLDDVSDTVIDRDTARKIFRENLISLSGLRRYCEVFKDFAFLKPEKCSSKKDIDLAFFRDGQLVCPYRDVLVYEGKNFSIFKTSRWQDMDMSTPFMYICVPEADSMAQMVWYDGPHLSIEYRDGQMVLDIDGDIVSLEDAEVYFQ